MMITHTIKTSVDLVSGESHGGLVWRYADAARAISHASEQTKS